MSNIELIDICKEYSLIDTSIFALKNINLTINKGEFLSLAGPSGSGKTTLLNIIGAIIQPSSGKCIVDGQDICSLNNKELSSYRFKKIGMIFQNDNLIDALNVRDNILYGIAVGAKKDRGNIKEYKGKVEQIIEKMGLTHWQNHNPGELSGGQRQRISIARALIKDPSIILADEPTASLDSETAMEIMNLMRTINKEKGITFIISSHDKRVLELTDRTVFLHDGNIV